MGQLTAKVEYITALFCGHGLTLATIIHMIQAACINIIWSTI